MIIEIESINHKGCEELFEYLIRNERECKYEGGNRPKVSIERIGKAYQNPHSKFLNIVYEDLRLSIPDETVTQGELVRLVEVFYKFRIMPLKNMLGMSREEVLNSPIESLNLNNRSYKRLKRAKINTVKDLAVRTEIELLNLGGFGKKSLLESRQRLGELGLRHGYEE